MSKTEIVPAPKGDLEHTEGNILDVIARASADPTVNVEKLERLLAIQQTIISDQRRTSYMASMAKLQEKLPQVTKSGTIFDRDGKVRSTFAKIEDIDVAIRPLCAEDGFAFSLDSKAVPSGTEFTSTLSHRDGHSETKTLVLPTDSHSSRSAAQNAGSTISYARRYLLMMHLNLVTRDVDNDGQGEAQPITADQVAELRAALKATGRSEPRFLLFLKVGSLEECPAHKFKPARALASEPKEPGK